MKKVWTLFAGGLAMISMLVPSLASAAVCCTIGNNYASGGWLQACSGGPDPFKCNGSGSAYAPSGGKKRIDVQLFYGTMATQKGYFKSASGALTLKCTAVDTGADDGILGSANCDLTTNWVVLRVQPSL